MGYALLRWAAKFLHEMHVHLSAPPVVIVFRYRAIVALKSNTIFWAPPLRSASTAPFYRHSIDSSHHRVLVRGVLLGVRKSS